jgi:hypothetical protein
VATHVTVIVRFRIAKILPRSTGSWNPRPDWPMILAK